MTTSELKLIERALGAKTVNALAEVAVEPDRAAWIRLAVAVTMAVFHEIRLSPEIAAMVQGLWVKAGYGPPKSHAPCDAYVADPCYSFWRCGRPSPGIWPKRALRLRLKRPSGQARRYGRCSGSCMASRLARRWIRQRRAVGPSCGRCARCGLGR